MIAKLSNNEMQQKMIQFYKPLPLNRQIKQTTKFMSVKLKKMFHLSYTDIAAMHG